MININSIAKEYEVKIALSSANDAPNTAPILLVGDIHKNIKNAKELGYDAIEVHMRENSICDFSKLITTLENHNIRIASIVTGRLATQEKISLTNSVKTKSEKAINGLKKYIEIAAVLNTDIIIGWIRGKLDGLSKINYAKVLGPILKDLEEYAQTKHVKIMIEAINRYEIDTLNTAGDILNLIDQYELKNTYVHLDTFHMNIEEASISDTIRDCGGKLGYIHFADSNRCYPGAGHIDFVEILKALKDVSYSGYISIECLPWPSHKEAALQAIMNIRCI